jgi:hypothetical protein
VKKHFIVQDLFALATVFGVASCQESTKSEPVNESPTVGHELVAGPARDLGVLTQVIVDAFREDHGVYRAKHLTHEVQVIDGLVDITPYNVELDGTRKRGGSMGLRTAAIMTSEGYSLDGERDVQLRNGVVEISHDQVTETIANREDGIEQAWSFPTAPQTTGDLVVTVDVTGHAFAAETASGLHFKSKAGLGFLYSNATWVDAVGTEWPVQSKWVDGQISMTIPQSVLAETVFPAVLDPTVNGETAVDGPVNGGTGSTANNAAIAFDGTNYLVVWEDRRLSVDQDIFAARISPAGAILTVNDILVNADVGPQTHPTVTFANGAYVVAWETRTAAGQPGDIAAARITTGGVVTQLGVVATTPADDTLPALGSAGTRAFLAWTAGGVDISGSLYSGTTFGAPIAVAATANSESDPAVTGSATAGTFLVAWSEGTTAAADLRGQLVTSLGALSGAAFNISAGAGRQFDPAAAFDGTNFVLAWTVNANGLNIFGARVTTAGVVLDTHPEGTPVVTVGGVSVTLAAGSQEQPKIACTAGGCFVTWRDQRNLATTNNDVYGQRMTPTFTLNGPEIVVSNVTNTQQAPAVGADGTNFFAAWDDLRDARQSTLFASTVSSAGAVGAAAPIVTGFNKQASAAVGRTGTTNVVAWTDSRTATGADIDFVRFISQTKQEATARVASSAVFAQSEPALSSSNSGSVYAVWSDTRGGVNADIYGTKINADGSVTNGAGIAIAVAANDQLVPKVASNTTGTAALAVWQDRRSGQFDIEAALLDANGNVSAPVTICNATGDQTRPAVSYDSTNNQWMVVWSDSRVAANPDIYAARVSSTGAVLDANGVNLNASVAGSQFSPAIAFTNGLFLAVWQDRRTDGAGDIYGTRLRGGASLQILDGTGIQYGSTTGGQSSPAVGSTIGSFIVAWQDSRNAATTGADIYGVGVGTTGAVNAAEFVITNLAGDESSPSLSDIGTTGGARIAYHKVRTDLQTTRVISRLITTSGGTGTSCSINSQCGVGGFCVDNKCCENACGGGSKTDCMACSAELTGQLDGTCAPVMAGRVCRVYADTFCDLEEKCDGTNTVCPPDLGRFEFRTCTIAGGGSGLCPSNTAAGSPHVCQ